MRRLRDLVMRLPTRQTAELYERGVEPYLWCVVQYLNHRIQVFVPLCLIDDLLFLRNESVTIPTWHYQLTGIPFDGPCGESEYYPDDWSSEEER